MAFQVFGPPEDPNFFRSTSERQKKETDIYRPSPGPPAAALGIWDPEAEQDLRLQQASLARALAPAGTAGH